MGEICFCDFLAADLRDSESDIFHCVRARDYDATALGRRRILVLFIRGTPLADRFFRSSAPNRNLCLRTRTDPRSEEHTSELQSRQYLVCSLLLEKNKT